MHAPYAATTEITLTGLWCNTYYTITVVATAGDKDVLRVATLYMHGPMNV